MGIYKQRFNPVSGQFNLVSSATVMTFKEGVATASALPPTGNTQGDARIANDTGHLYIWDGSTWVDQGDIIDAPPGPQGLPGEDGKTPNLVGNWSSGSQYLYFDAVRWTAIYGGGEGTPTGLWLAIVPYPTIGAEPGEIAGEWSLIASDGWQGVEGPPGTGGATIIQDDTASLDPDETKIITHTSDPLYKRVVEILVQLQQVISYQLSEPYEANYDYDEDKVTFWPMGWDYVTLASMYGADGQVAYYIFNDDVTDVLDGHVHNATNVNGTFTTGIVEKALSLNGTNAYMDIPNHSDFYIPDPVTNSIGFEFWIDASTDGEIISLWNETDNRRSWRIYLQAGYVCMDVSVDGITTAATSIGSHIGLGYNQHVGIYLNDYYGGLYWKMYVGGSSLMIPGFSPVFTYPLFSNTIDPIRVGAKCGTPSNFINARIAELAIYRNYDLTQPMGMHSSVFQAHYNRNMMGNRLSQYSTDMQNIKTNASGQIDTSDWLGIQYASFYGDYYGDFEVTALFSVDGRTTWQMWDGVAWQTVLETDQGTNTASLPSTRAEWDLLFVPGTLDYILQLKTNDANDTPEIYSLTIGAYKPGYMPAGWKGTFSCISDTETQIRNATLDQAAPETLFDIKTNIVF
jgi:hypothetical protein